MSFCTFHWSEGCCFRKRTLCILLQRLLLGGRKMMSLGSATLRSTDFTLLWDLTAKIKVFVFEKFPFFLQRKFPHQAALPSLEATRHLFKKHCNKVGSFPRSSLSLECPNVKFLFAFCVFVLWLCDDLCCQHGFCKPMHLYHLLTEAIQGGGQCTTILFNSFFLSTFFSSFKSYFSHT